MKSIFITGTDTDVGKTYITCELIHYLKSKQQRVAAIKPIASGCEEVGAERFSHDEMLLRTALGHEPSVISKWRFLPPIAPHIAAEQESVDIQLDSLVEFYEASKRNQVDYLLVEGAGGLFVPLNEQHTWLDFLTVTQMPAILVVGMKLGCINHALLTAAALEKHQVKCLGWVANCLDPEMLSLDENIQSLKQRLNAPLLATVSYKGALKLTSHFLL